MVKRIVGTLLILVLVVSTIAQTDTIIEEFGNTIEKIPRLNKRFKNITEFVSSHLNYPKEALSDSIEGTIFLCFIVDTIGKTRCHKIIRGIRSDLNIEALRIAKLIKFDYPALKRGKPIEFKYNLRIEFVLPRKRKEK